MFCLNSQKNSRNLDVLEKLKEVIISDQNQFFKSTIDAILRTFLRLETTNLGLVVG